MSIHDGTLPLVVNNGIAFNIEGFGDGMTNFGKLWINRPRSHKFSVAPSFVDPNSHNYQVQSDSNAIDAGTDTFAPMEDLYGDVRPQDDDQDGITGINPGADAFLQKVFIWTGRVYLPVAVK